MRLPAKHYCFRGFAVIHPMNKWVRLTEGKDRGKEGQTWDNASIFFLISLGNLYTETLDSLWCCLCGQRPFNPATNKAFPPPNSDSLSESVNSRVQSAGAKNGPCSKPTEPALGLQWWSQLDPSGGTEAPRFFSSFDQKKEPAAQWRGLLH